MGLSACTLFPTDENEYKTPELFLNKAKDWDCAASYHISEENYYVDDCNKAIYQSLTTITEYKQISKIPNRDRLFFVYENVIPATSGPNIARMTVYNNGYLEIYRKQSLGSSHYYYYSFDETLAESLYTFAKDKIYFAIAAENTAREEAEAFANIGNFFIDAKAIDKVHSIVWGEVNYDFYAEIDIVNMMYEITYTQTIYEETFFSTKFVYGASSYYFDYFHWELELHTSFNMVKLHYFYRDVLDRKYAVNLYYSIPEDEGRALYNYVYQYGKVHNINGV